MLSTTQSIILIFAITAFLIGLFCDAEDKGAGIVVFMTLMILIIVIGMTDTSKKTNEKITKNKTITYIDYDYENDEIKTNYDNTFNYVEKLDDEYHVEYVKEKLLEDGYLELEINTQAALGYELISLEAHDSSILALFKKHNDLIRDSYNVSIYANKENCKQFNENELSRTIQKEVNEKLEKGYEIDYLLNTSNKNEPLVIVVYKKTHEIDDPSTPTIDSEYTGIKNDIN